MKIICIGRNYADHAAEMNAALPTDPVFFLKPDTAILSQEDFYYPSFTKEIHYECELVVKISKMGKHIDSKFASKYYNQVSLGIDFTARDLQANCKAKGLPWEIAKAFDQSAVISKRWISITPEQIQNLSFSFYQNGELKQHGNPSMMLFNIDEIIAYISKFITLKTGDLIFTGTPAGVGPITIGDELVGVLNGEEMYRIQIK